MAILPYNRKGISVGSFEKHIALAKEELQITKDAYAKKSNTVVGDLATKVAEQLIEAGISRKGEHFGDHKSRYDYANKEYPVNINKAMRKIWFAYGDLGYDGLNGNRAKIAMENLKVVIRFFRAWGGLPIFRWRYRQDDVSTGKQKITSAKDVVDIVMTQLRDLKTEVFKVIYLDSNNRIIDITDATCGTVNRAMPIVREIIHYRGSL